MLARTVLPRPAGDGGAGGRACSLQPAHHAPPNPAYAATAAQPVKVDNELYGWDYVTCILCDRCVEACGKD